MDLLLRPFRFVKNLSVLLFSFSMVCAVVIVGFFLMLFLWRFLILLVTVGLFLIVIVGFLKILSDPW